MENKIYYSGMTYDCADAKTLAEFYGKLFGWEVSIPHEGYAGAAGDGVHITFQTVEGYQPPVWPWEDGKQAQMAHLDLYTDNLEAGIAHAIACGATVATTQYFDGIKVMIDPAGHPFCLIPKG